jgi:hypothetical protein
MAFWHQSLQAWAVGQHVFVEMPWLQYVHRLYEVIEQLGGGWSGGVCLVGAILGITGVAYLSYKYDAGFRSMIREGMVKVRYCLLFQLKQQTACLLAAETSHPFAANEGCPLHVMMPCFIVKLRVFKRSG